MGMMKAYASFAEWKKDQSAKHQRLVGALQRVVKSAAPHLSTTVKWGQGCFADGDEPKLFIHAEPDHLQFGFYRGSSMKDPAKLLTGKGKYVRHVKIRTPKDIDARALSRLIVQVTS
jgi:hypothetical protein